MLRGVTGQVPVEIKFKSPDKWHYNQTFAWGDQISYGYDGTTAWIHDTRSIETMPPGQLLDFQLWLDHRAPLNIKKIFPKMITKGSEKVGEKEATTLLATSQIGSTVELAFDNETGQLLRAGDMLFEDYRAVGNVKRPFRILLGNTVGEDHLQMKLQFSETQHDLDVDNSLFQQPTCVLPMKAAPLYKSRTRVDVSIEALEACVGEYQHPEQTGITYIISRQQNHLMFQRSDREFKIEIMPESETDYFMEFLGNEFHFQKDAAGKVTDMIIKANRTVTTKKIK